MADRTGQPIDLRWDGTPEEWYVRGHVSLDEAAEAIADQMMWDLDVEEVEDLPRIATYHTHARWVPARDEWGDPVTRFVECAPGRGAFAVTRVSDLDAADARRRQRQEQEAREAKLIAFVREWFSEATDARANAFRVGEGVVWFRLPGLQGDVSWRESEPDRLMVQRRDLEAWHELYGERKRPDWRATPQPQLRSELSPTGGGA